MPPHSRGWRDYVARRFVHLSHARQSSISVKPWENLSDLVRSISLLVKGQSYSYCTNPSINDVTQMSARIKGWNFISKRSKVVFIVTHKCTFLAINQLKVRNRREIITIFPPALLNNKTFTRNKLKIMKYSTWIQQYTFKPTSYLDTDPVGLRRQRDSEIRSCRHFIEKLLLTISKSGSVEQRDPGLRKSRNQSFTFGLIIMRRWS